MSTIDKSTVLTAEIQRERCEAAVRRAKEFLLTASQAIDNERLSILLDVYRNAGTEPAILLRARLLEKVLLTKKLYIDDNPIAGTFASKPAGVYVYPEYDGEWVVKELNTAMMSHLGQVNLTDEDKKLMREAGSFFKKTGASAMTRELAKELYGYDPRVDIAAGVVTPGVNFTTGAGNVDYGGVIRKGLTALIAETEERLRATPVDTEHSSRIDFYRAVLITLRALVAFAHRYAELAESMAAETDDEIRRAELLEIATVCRHVPAHPARTLREAIQFWWFLHLGIQIEQSGCGSSPGRLGQYLNDYYLSDLASGQSREDAQAWLKCLFVKLLEYGYYQGIIQARLNSGHTGQTINVGGLDADGRDATCELDYLLLDTQIELRNIQPTITVLYHDGLKEDFLFKCVELDRTGLGQPQWMNTRVIIERLLARHAKAGITLADARGCINMSCVGTGVAGKTAFVRASGTYNMAKNIELVLNNGVDPMSRKRVGVETGDPREFKDFEEFFAAYQAQTRHTFKKIRRLEALEQKVLHDILPCPFRSALNHGCLERGVEQYAGGTDYYLYYAVINAGIDTANSLAAVKELVFDKKLVTMDEMIKALEADFAGYEHIYDLCMKAPKHGNNDPQMNALVRRMYDCYIRDFEESGRSWYTEKHPANLEAYSLSIHNYFGMLTGALPSGHRKARPLSDGSVSATPGTDKNGPLALITSAAQALDTARYGSNHLNLKFHPSAIAGIAGARNLLALIKSYMDMGGSHIQFNVVSSDTLRKAKESPDEYRDLTVRVAGFSAYFTRLHEGVQDEIIARTEH